VLVFIGDKRGTSTQHLTGVQAEHRANLVPPELLGELLLVSTGDRRSLSAQHLTEVQAEHRASLVSPKLSVFSDFCR